MTSKTGLCGDRVALRNVVESDLPTLFEHQRDPEAVRMAVVPSRDREAFMVHWANILADPTVISRAIMFCDQLAGNVVGFDRDGRRMLGYWLGREFWGRGVASSAVAKFLHIEKTRPLHAWVAVSNPGSLRVVKKCGFVVESIEKTAGLDGELIDDCLLVLRRGLGPKCQANVDGPDLNLASGPLEHRQNEVDKKSPFDRDYTT
jgi:RimJ/RimL family protein N-acetyltransferase